MPRGGARPGNCICRGGYTNIWDGSIASAFAGGTGTTENPYQIATGAQLAYLASSVNSGETYAGKNFVLTADIDLNGLRWTPIANTFSDVLFGGSDYRIFAGNLDGQGYTVSNVAIGSESAPLESDVFGLFGATAGKISNLHLNTVSIYGVAKNVSGYVIGPAGGLVGSASGNVENCHVSGLTMTMTTPGEGGVGAYWIGGLVGVLDEGGQIDECSASGKIQETSGKGSIGGLIGELGKTSKITYSRADVALDVKKTDSKGHPVADVGGFIGKGNGDRDPETVIRNCYATGDVTGGAYIGGFAGSIWGLNIKNCYATGNVSGAAANMASFAGTDGPAAYAYGSIINCYATGEVIGNAPNLYAFAMQDATPRSEITNCYFSDANSKLKNSNESSVAKPLDEMKTESFANALNAGDSSNGWVFVNGEALGGAEPADYSAVDAALAKANALKKDDYKDFSAVETAVNAVARGKNITEQDKVDAMAKAIEDAITKLQYKDADYSAVDAAIAKANALNRDEYTDFSAVEAAVNAVVRGKPLSEQAKVDAMAQAIENAITALQYKGADYSAVDAAIAKADKLNRDEYKDFSAVEAAVNAVVRGKPLSEQTAVDAMAKAIEDAIAALQYKGADYRAVDAAIAKANALNRDDYKDFSAVDAAVSAVVRGKPLSEQAAVDAMAKAIEDAITELEKKPVEMTVQLPQTGDDSNLALWTALLLVSGAAIGMMMAGKKRNYGK